MVTSTLPGAFYIVKSDTVLAGWTFSAVLEIVENISIDFRGFLHRKIGTTLAEQAFSAVLEIVENISIDSSEGRANPH